MNILIRQLIPQTFIKWQSLCSGTEPIALALQRSQSGDRDRSGNKLLQACNKCYKRGINKVHWYSGRNCFALPVEARDGFGPEKQGQQ